MPVNLAMMRLPSRFGMGPILGRRSTIQVRWLVSPAAEGTFVDEEANSLAVRGLAT